MIILNEPLSVVEGGEKVDWLGEILDQSNKILLKSIARGVRSWVEERDQLRKHPTGDLCGWCAIAAGKLFEELKKMDFEPKIHLAKLEYSSHCFVTVDDHVIDVTATQFKQFRDVPVVIMHEREAQIYPFYAQSVTFNNPLALKEAQRKDRWPSEQVVF